MLLLLRYIGTIEYYTATKITSLKKFLFSYVCQSKSWKKGPGTLKLRNLRGFNKGIIYKRFRETNKDYCRALGLSTAVTNPRPEVKIPERVAYERDSL